MRFVLTRGLVVRLACVAGLRVREQYGPSGRNQWLLFPDGQVPGEEPGRYGPEAHAAPDPSNAMARKCAPGDTSDTWYHNVTEPALVPFLVRPSNPKRKNITAIILPGGGFEFLSWVKEGSSIATWLNSVGISAFVLKYRVPVRPWLRDRWDPKEKHLAARMDAQRALGLVRQRAPSVRLEGTRIGFIGFSAGGILSTEVSGTPKRLYPRIDDADDFSPHPDFQVLVYAVGDPKYVKRRRQPPTFLAIAEDDPCVDVSLAFNYYTALRRNAPPSELHVYPDGRHSFGTCTGPYPDRWYEACSWTNQSLMFLEQQVLMSPHQPQAVQAQAFQQ